jgi:GT2 family glycosyltransferase
MAIDYAAVRRELEQIKERSGDSELADLVDRLISELERERNADRRRLDRFAENLRDIDSRLLTVENSKIFRLLQRAGAFLRGGKQSAGDLGYQAWIKREAARTPSPAAVAERSQRFTYRPTIGIQIDRSDEQTAAGMRNQSWSHWEWHSTAASGDIIAILSQDGTLAPNALFHVVEALQTEKYDMIYADEDRLDDAGIRCDPLFKPAWSPDLVGSPLYPGSFLVVSRSAWDSAGSDLSRLLAEPEQSVKHIPRVLFHARSRTAATRERQGRTVSGTPLASIVICSKTPRLLARCLRAIDRHTAYPARQIVVVEHGPDPLPVNSKYVRVPYTGPFNFAAMNNAGVKAASGEIVVLLNDDIEPISADWLSELIAHAQRPEIGVAGARLLYPNGTIQHAGMAVGIMDGAGHPNRGGFETAHWPWSRYTRNVSAVTGACMAVRRSVWDELGGFDGTFPVNYNDVDFCLRARRAGYRVVYEPAAVLRHHESATRTRGTILEERELFYERWGAIIEEGDPYYNPNLTRTREDCSLSES